MIDSTLADLRNSKSFFDAEEIIHVFDGRKKEDLGYFVPKYFEKGFKLFLDDIEKKQKLKLLKKVAKAQKEDPIEEGCVSDGIG